MKMQPMTLLALGTIVGGVASADVVTVHTDRPSYEAAAGVPQIVEDFTPTTHFPLVSGVLNSLTRDAGLLEGDIEEGVTYSTPIGEGNFFNIDGGGGYDGGFLDGFAPSDRDCTIVFHNSDPNDLRSVNGFGFEFSGVLGATDVDVTISFSAGPDQNFNVSYLQGFYGFTSDARDITGAVVSNNGSFFGFDFDNFTFDEIGAGGGDLYANGAPNYQSGNEMTNWLQANDFTLRSKSTVEHVDFSVLDTNVGSNLANWDGTASWYIYENAGGAPGSLIASGAGTSVTATFDQTGSFDFYDFSMDLDAPQCLDAGTYWLGLHLNRACDVRADLYWSTTDPNGTFGHHEDTNCVGTFFGPGNEHSFTLSGSDGCGSGECLSMVVSTLISNAPADWVVCGATPDVEVAIVYGFRPGSTAINGFAGYCADFGIDGVNQKKVVCRKKADGSGCITCRVGSLPAQPGTRILTQAAMKGTCPDPCMSNLDDQIVQ